MTALAHPVIPEATAKIWTQLGLGDIKQFDLSATGMGTTAVGHEAGRSAASISAGG